MYPRFKYFKGIGPHVQENYEYSLSLGNFTAECCVTDRARTGLVVRSLNQSSKLHRSFKCITNRKSQKRKGKAFWNSVKLSQFIVQQSEKMNFDSVLTVVEYIVSELRLYSKCVFKAQIWLKLKHNNKIAFSGYSFCVKM